jgi:cytochrome c peroxidase
MAKIEDLISKKPSNNKTNNDNSMSMDGSFSCQTCNDVSDEAQFDRNAGVITWTCKNNHLSKVTLG